MTNAYENEIEMNIEQKKDCCFEPLTLETVFHVIRRMFR